MLVRRRLLARLELLRKFTAYQRKEPRSYLRRQRISGDDVLLNEVVLPVPIDHAGEGIAGDIRFGVIEKDARDIFIAMRHKRP